jgi:hypothetical protein
MRHSLTTPAGKRSWLPRVIVLALMVVLVSACGSSSHPSVNTTATRWFKQVCNTTTASAVTVAFHHIGSSLLASHVTGNNGMPQCNYVSRGPGGKADHASLTVNLDDGPQVVFRLDRTDEEATQIFGTPPPGWHAPIGQYGLGTNAAWYIANQQLMATNGRYLFTVTVQWPHASRAAMIKLAREAIAPYMKKNPRHLSPTAITSYP